MPPKKPGSKGDGVGKPDEVESKQRTPATGKQAPAKKPAAKTGTRAPAKTGAKAGAGAAPRASAKRAEGPNLSGDLRQFVSENPHGWGHDEWLGLLDRLRERGHSVDDTEQVGRDLERERLATKLEGVQGVGPQRVKAISERYGSIWSLMYADVDDLVQAASIPRPLAERIKAAV